MADFLPSQCGQRLLKLVAKGSSILAQMQRLAGNIPKIFLGGSSSEQRFQKVIFDYSYLKDPDAYDQRIQQSAQMFQIDEQLKRTYFHLLERFYSLFESIYLYYSDIQIFYRDLKNQQIISQSLQVVFFKQLILSNTEGKQLISQSIYLFGVMLLLLDRLIPGNVREKLLVTYYRYKGGQSRLHNIDQVRRLCKSTGYIYNPKTKIKRLERYPEDYFGRFPLQQDDIENLISAIKDDDIYKQKVAYPSPKHRSFCLATQSSHLFVILFFVPDYLIRQKAKMRQIVDKHFYDTWVLPFYLGYIVDLTWWWQPYKAAKIALGNILDLDNIQEFIQYYNQILMQNNIKCKQYLNQGVLNQEYVLTNINTLMDCLRDSNISVRWLMLHRSTTHEKVSRMIIDKTNPEEILALLLKCSEYENQLKIAIEKILQTKEQAWNQNKTSCVQRMDELAQYYSSGKSLGKNTANEAYKQWFQQMGKQFSSLQFTDSTYAGRKVRDFVQAFQDIEQYQQISSNINVKQYLFEAKKQLKQLVKLANFRKIFRTQIEIICDITWCWQCIKKYIPLMQEEITKNPKSALLLKNTFTKLSSILNTPMVRIVQSDSPDITSVSKYYSNELVKFVKKVLQIIPFTVFQTLNEMLNFTSNLKTVTQKINKSQLKQYNQFELRKQQSFLTNKITVFSQSIIAMQTYLVGVIEVNPKQILEDGIRKELIKLILVLVDKCLQFREHNVQQLQYKLKLLGEKLQGFKNSIEYIQDFIQCFGLKIYYEQFQRLMSAYIDIETHSLINKNTQIQELNYDQDIPMPDNQNKQYGCITYVGRLLKQLLFLTNPSKTIYIDGAFAFYQLGSGKQILSLRTLGMIGRCIRVSGLNGLSKLLAVQIKQIMKIIQNILRKNLDDTVKKQLFESYSEIKNITSFNDRYQKIMQNLKKTLKNLCSQLQIQLQKLGQMTIIRKMICAQLQMMGKVGSPRLFIGLQSLNQAVIQDILKKQQISDEQLVAQNELLFIIGQLLNHFGMTDPTKKIYLTVEVQQYLPIILFTLFHTNVIFSNQINNFVYDGRLKCMLRKPKIQIQPNYMGVGISILLKQYHPINTQIFYGFISYYIKSTMNFLFHSKETSKNPEILLDMFTYISFLDQMGKLANDKINSELGLMMSLNKQMLRK